MKRVKPKMASEVRLKKDQKIVVTIKRLGINGEGIGYYKRKDRLLFLKLYQAKSS